MRATRHRGTVLSHDGMVASAHPLVSLTGARVLQSGGTAADATLAMAAMCFVVLPGQCGVGGDAFAVSYNARSRAYRSIQGSGTGPGGTDTSWYVDRGHSSIPMDGPLAVAVPGALACLVALHNAGGTRPLDELWRPAIEAAERGVAATEKTVRDITEHAAALAADDSAATVFLPGGRPPRVGERLAQQELAATLRQLAAKPSSMYTGELAERCLHALRSGGAPFAGPEWTDMCAVDEPTVTAAYGDLTVHTGTPPSSGYMVLAQAGVLDGVLAELPWLGEEAVHWLAETAARAFGDRFESVGSDSPGWRHLLEQDAVLKRRAEIVRADPRRSLTPMRAGDTTSLVVVDGDGNAVSYIHSLAFTFGARVMVPGTGIMLNNRLGRGAYLIPGHPNEVRAGRKPMHTLVAWIASGPDGTVRVVGNTPGGDGQVQWNTQLLSHLADHHLDPQQAVEAPRFTAFPGSDANALGSPPKLSCEPGLGHSTLDALQARGHVVEVTEPYGAGGGAQLIVRDPSTGVLAGGSDPRQDGCALAI